MPTILVTGGAGFLGSHLVKKLLQDDTNHVICLDNFSTGRKENVSELLNHTRLDLVFHDLSLPLPSSVVSRVRDISQIYHLACPASPVHYQKDPLSTFLTCVRGTENIINVFCKDIEKNKVSPTRILFSSTSEVYGDPLIHPQNEEYLGNVNCLGPRSCYDEGKRAAETLFYIAKNYYSADVAIARIFNTYGPSMCLEDGRVISNFIAQTLQNNPITIYGDGHQTRSFCYVDDTVRGLISLMNSTHFGPINIGNPDEHTVFETASIIHSMVHPDKPIDIQYVALGPDDPTKRKPDITKAKTLLNWEPTVPLNDGLKITIEDFKNRLWNKA